MELSDYSALRYPTDLKPGDILAEAGGVYQVTAITPYPFWGREAALIHIQVSTIAGPVMGGLLRYHLEHVSVMRAAK